MKEFFKYVLATVVGGIITAAITVFLAVAGIAGIVASVGSPRTIRDNSVLVVRLDGVIEERAQDNPVMSLLGDSFARTGLNDILSAIRKAKTNDKIKGIYIDAGTLQAGYSTLSEIRAALSDFRQSGKWVVAYADASSQGAYYAASAADKIYLNPSGMIDLHGLSVETMYVKELYEKLGIHFQIIKVGKYKSATETYSETAMSDANREQVTAFVTGIWRNVADSIAAGRGITRAQVNALADRFTAFVSPEELVKGGLADSLAYGDGVKHELKRRLGIRETDDLNLLSVSDMRSIDGAHNIIKATRSKRGDGAHNIIKATRSKRGDEPAKRGKQIAVYYAEGTIIDSETEAVPSFGGAQIAGDKVCRDLERLMDADDVSAVVLRVNSPGGSAHAAEQIWHYLARLKEKKPVVVSMGDYAASGGYYISCNASYIVAEPTTITGSIGIYGIIPEASELLTDKLGLHFDGVKTNEHADFGAGIFSYALRPFTADEREIVQKYIDRGYALFRRRVADGRSESIDEVERIAQGHVWTGQDALKIRLVDSLGTLDDAVRKAAELAGLDSYYTEEYPAAESWFDTLFSSDTTGGLLANRLRTTLGDRYLPFASVNAAANVCPIQALMPYFIFIN